MSALSKRVLLVEDHPDNRLLATMTLESEGYEVIGAETGAAGILAAGQGDFAFVLLDLQLPDLDGFEVARTLRERFTATELPIIAVSAFAMSTDRRRAFAAGCTGYIEKPIDVDVFVAQVRCLTGVGTA